MKKILVAGGLLSTMALSGLAYAGWVSHNSAYIGSNYAVGSLIGARNSSDPYNYIACEIYSYPDYEIATCYAGSGSNYKHCSTGSGTYGQHMRDAIRSIGPASNIYFSWNPADSSCTSVFVNNASWQMP